MNTDTQQKIEGKEHFHGSDLEKIEKYFGIPKEQITGFGANVNPLGISDKMPAGRSTGRKRMYRTDLPLHPDQPSEESSDRLSHLFRI